MGVLGVGVGDLNDQAVAYRHLCGAWGKAHVSGGFNGQGGGLAGGAPGGRGRGKPGAGCRVNRDP